MVGGGGGELKHMVARKFKMPETPADDRTATFLVVKSCLMCKNGALLKSRLYKFTLK